MVRSQTFLVCVHPRAKRNQVVVVSPTELKVQVTAPPVEGRANAALIELLAKHWGVRRRQIEIVTGGTHRHKVVRLMTSAAS